MLVQLPRIADHTVAETLEIRAHLPRCAGVTTLSAVFGVVLYLRLASEVSVAIPMVWVAGIEACTLETHGVVVVGVGVIVALHGARTAILVVVQEAHLAAIAHVAIAIEIPGSARNFAHPLAGAHRVIHMVGIRGAAGDVPST